MPRKDRLPSQLQVTIARARWALRFQRDLPAEGTWRLERDAASGSGAAPTVVAGGKFFFRPHWRPATVRATLPAGVTTAALRADGDSATWRLVVEDQVRAASFAFAFASRDKSGSGERIAWRRGQPDHVARADGSQRTARNHTTLANVPLSGKWPLVPSRHSGATTAAQSRSAATRDLLGIDRH